MPRQEPVSITGLWVRTLKPHEVEVLIEVDGQWYLMMTEPIFDEAGVSHIMEPLGMRYAIQRGPDWATEEEDKYEDAQQSERWNNRQWDR